MFLSFTPNFSQTAKTRLERLFAGTSPLFYLCFAQGGKTHGKKYIPPTGQDQKYDAKPVRTRASNTIVSFGTPTGFGSPEAMTAAQALHCVSSPCRAVFDASVPPKIYRTHPCCGFTSQSRFVPFGFASQNVSGTSLFFDPVSQDHRSPRGIPRGGNVLRFANK